MPPAWASGTSSGEPKTPGRGSSGRWVTRDPLSGGRPADSAGRSLCLCAGLFPGEGHGGRRPPVRPGPGGVSAERLYAELGKLLCGKAAGRVLRQYPEVLSVVIPSWAPWWASNSETNTTAMMCTPTLPWQWTMCRRSFPSGWRCFSTTWENPTPFSWGGRAGPFYGHARRSVALAETILTRLRAPPGGSGSR